MNMEELGKAMNGKGNLVILMGELSNEAAIGRTEPIVIHMPLTQHGDDQDTKTDVDIVRDMSAIGVSWCNWGGAAADVASAVDEIRRFGDTVIAKVR